MRQRFAKTRAGSLTAAAVLAVAGLGSAAQANLVLDLRLAGGGNATTVSPNQTVNLEVIGTVTSGSSAQLQDAFFGVQNPNASTQGTLSGVSLSSAFQGVTTDGTNVTTSSTGGTYTLAAGDGNSIGSTDSTSATGWVFARATSMQSLTVGTPTVLGTLSYQVSGSATGSVNLAVNTRQSGGNSLIVPALWMEDSTLNDGSTSGTYTAGSGVTISIASSVLKGDMNHDGLVNNQDINPFVLALTNPTAYQAQFPGYDYQSAGDLSGDGLFNNQDINPFVTRLTSGGEPGIAAALVAVPEPASLGLVGGLGLMALARRRRSM
jgi:hypothetical protein